MTDLAGSNWRVDHVDNAPQAPLPGSPITLSFAVTGMTYLVGSGCNSGFGPVRTVEETLVLDPPVTTTAACLDALGIQDHWVSTVFNDTPELTWSGAFLVVSGSGMRLFLVRT